MQVLHVHSARRAAAQRWARGVPTVAARPKQSDAALRGGVSFDDATVSVPIVSVCRVSGITGIARVSACMWPSGVVAL